ncbi:MAG: hypothetical protein Q9159_000446 [Coniocarpon cinnabarinum]
MASSIPSDSRCIAILRKSFAQNHLPTQDHYPLSELSRIPLYNDAHYDDADKSVIQEHLTTSQHICSPNEDKAKTNERLATLNTHLASRTTLLGSKPSVADVAMYARLAPVLQSWTAEERTGETGYHYIVRWFDFVQRSEMMGLKLDNNELINIDPDDVKVQIKPVDAKAEKERKKKEKEAAAAAQAAAGNASTNGVPVRQGKGESVANAVGASIPVGQPSEGTVSDTKAGQGTSAAPEQKRAKKEKQPKPQKQAAPEKPLSPALIDLRVGHILKAERHPNADSLYVSTIAVGDATGTENTSEYDGKVVRTVCSGLNGLVPLEEMQGRKVVAVCNLKPVTMRGIKSCAMVLAASPRLKEGEEDHHKGPVELVDPPATSGAGERVLFEGWEGEPEAQLNPKKKVWDYCQMGFTTTDDGSVAFEKAAVEQLKEAQYGANGPAMLKTKEGVCKVKTLKGATVR